MDLCVRDGTEICPNGILVCDAEATGGIRQGCTGSLQLFVIVVNIINRIVETAAPVVVWTKEERKQL